MTSKGLAGIWESKVRSYSLLRTCPRGSSEVRERDTMRGSNISQEGKQSGVSSALERRVGEADLQSPSAIQGEVGDQLGDIGRVQNGHKTKEEVKQFQGENPPPYAPKAYCFTIQSVVKMSPVPGSRVVLLVQ